MGSGDGARLHDVTKLADGTSVPKQFWNFGDEPTLMSRAIGRAKKLVVPERVVPVLAANHRRWWEREMRGIPRENLMVQPCNRGTAPGLLLPMMHVASRDPEAVVAVLPCDHHFEDERVVLSALTRAFRSAALRSEVILLGMTPSWPETSYGWIDHGESAPSGTSHVNGFVEKPHLDQAKELLQSGALWNTFMMIGSAKAFLTLFATATPDLHLVFRALPLPLSQFGSPSPAIVGVYPLLAPCDFSREVLQSEPVREHLRVARVPSCGWSDLGTPERLAQWQASRVAVGGLA